MAPQADRTLERIITLTKQERAAMNKSKSVFYVLDRELELAVGEKERSIGALRQHEKEHGC